MQHFRFSILLTLICLGVAFHWGGWSALLITAILAVMEVSLSFDNAVVNASVLKTWNRFWRQMFLTVGMLIAVFGMRLLFPLLIVAVTTGSGLREVARLALDDPDAYSRQLMAHHAEIAAFGGMFLLLVFLSFLFNENKQIHWVYWLEAWLVKLGKVDAAAILVALGLLLACGQLAEPHDQIKVLLAGIWGIVVFIGVNMLNTLLEQDGAGGASGQLARQGSLGGFLYLEVLDASFSFDGVIGAFAITHDVVIIMLGLCIGAVFVRSTTIFLVEKGTLDRYIYLEHGAHYAIGALALIMLLGIRYPVPELVTGLIGLAFIAGAMVSSIRYSRRMHGN
jgi:hypothetical protein